MASSTVIHAACFAVGALVGGGIVTAIGTSKRPIPPLPPAPAAPIVDVAPTGSTRISTPGTLVKVDTPVLKYGNPGPISDLLIRKAYVAAYDRRLKHPAWVRVHCSCVENCVNETDF